MSLESFITMLEPFAQRASINALVALLLSK